MDDVLRAVWPSDVTVAVRSADREVRWVAAAEVEGFQGFPGLLAYATWWTMWREPPVAHVGGVAIYQQGGGRPWARVGRTFITASTVDELVDVIDGRDRPPSLHPDLRKPTDHDVALWAVVRAIPPSLAPHLPAAEGLEGMWAEGDLVDADRLDVKLGSRCAPERTCEAARTELASVMQAWAEPRGLTTEVTHGTDVTDVRFSGLAQAVSRWLDPMAPDHHASDTADEPPSPGADAPAPEAAVPRVDPTEGAEP